MSKINDLHDSVYRATGPVLATSLQGTTCMANCMFKLTRGREEVRFNIASALRTIHTGHQTAGSVMLCGPIQCVGCKQPFSLQNH